MMCCCLIAATIDSGICEYIIISSGVALSSPSIIAEPKPIHPMATSIASKIGSEICFNPPKSSFVSGGVVLYSDSETPIPNESSRDDSESPVGNILDDVIKGHKISLDNSDPIKNCKPLKYRYYRGTPSDIIVIPDSNKIPRIFKKGFICTLNKSFGFIKTITQNKEIFFQSSSLVGDFSALELGQEVKYADSNIKPFYGGTVADIVTPLPKGFINRAAVFPEIIPHVVSCSLRGANLGQTEYKGYIDGNDGHGHPSGIISMSNKKEAPEVVDFQLDAPRKPVKIQSDRKRLRATVETVKGNYGFLSYKLDDRKKLFFHMSEVRDHQHLHPGDEVEFVIRPNPQNGNPSACEIEKKSQRPERLLNLGKKHPLDETELCVELIREPLGPGSDDTRGFSYRRFPRIPGSLTAPDPFDLCQVGRSEIID